MNIDKSINIRLDVLIALCHVIDDFNYFNMELDKYLDNEKKRNNKVSNLIKVVNNRSKIKNNIANKFYLRNKRIIDTIKLYCPFSMFINYCYDNDGKLKEQIMNMFNYLKENRLYINPILDLLNKLKELNFFEITFNSDEKFNEVYSADSYIFPYLDGKLQVVPSVNRIKFKSFNANYLLKLPKDFDNMPYVKYNPEITLNNLVFDKDLLPKELSYDETLGKIEDLYDNFLENEQLRKAIDLKFNIDNLDNTYNIMEFAIKRLDDCLTKEQLAIVLNELYSLIDKFKTLSYGYNSELIEKSDLITENIFEDEYKIYKLDIDKKN